MDDRLFLTLGTLVGVMVGLARGKIGYHYRQNICIEAYKLILDNGGNIDKDRYKLVESTIDAAIEIVNKESK